MTGRRGAGICAIGALDMAVWDLYGKVTGRPVWQLLGGSQKEFVTPYASLLPTGATLDEYQRSLLKKAAWARDFGFRAAKMEVCVKGPYTHNLLHEGVHGELLNWASIGCFLGFDSMPGCAISSSFSFI